MEDADILSVGSPGPSFKVDNRSKKIAVRLELHKNKFYVIACENGCRNLDFDPDLDPDERGLLSGLDPAVLEALEECMRSNLQEKGSSIDTEKAEKLLKEVENGLESDKMPPVKTLRVVIPRAVLLIFFTEDVCAGREKVKHLWSAKPEDWPTNVPFVDPNNASSGRKLQKEGLQSIYNFLKKYWQQNKTRIKKRIGAQVPTSGSVQPAEPREPWKVPLKILLHTCEKQLDETIQKYPSQKDKLQQLKELLQRLFKEVNSSHDSQIKFSDKAHEVTQLTNRIRLREDMSPQDVDRCRKIIDPISETTAKGCSDLGDGDKVPEPPLDGLDLLGKASAEIAKFCDTESESPGCIVNTSMYSMDHMAFPPPSPAIEGLTDPCTGLGSELMEGFGNGLTWPDTDSVNVVTNKLHDLNTGQNVEVTDQLMDTEKEDDILNDWPDVPFDLDSTELLKNFLGVFDNSECLTLGNPIKTVPSGPEGPPTMITCEGETLSPMIPIPVEAMDM